VTVTVRIPTQLRNLSGGAAEVKVEAGTVAEALKALDAAHPGFAERLFDESGALRRFVNVFVAEEDIRFLQGTDTVVTEGQVISVIPAVAGGCCLCRNGPQRGPFGTNT
jgi:molybdopterin synthase sulfur carrier subunit